MRRKNTDAEGTFSIESHIAGGILRVLVRGPFGANGGDRVMDQVRDLAKQHDVRLVLCDLRFAPVVVQPGRVNQRMRRVCEDETLASIKTAIIVNVRSSNLAYVEELATLNSVAIRVFTDGALAEQWLNESDARLAAAS